MSNKIKVTIRIDEELYNQLLKAIAETPRAARDVSVTAAVTRGIELVIPEIRARRAR